jgi:hypothetical protein
VTGPLPFRVRLQIALRELPIDWSGKYAGLYLLTYMNDEGEAWPTVERAVNELAIAKGTVRKGYKELERAGWLITRRSRSGNHYYPQLTPELERLVDNFLDAARRRHGQLPLPLDAHGLSLAGGSRGGQRAPGGGREGSPGGQRAPGGGREGSPADPEVVREVVREVEQASRADEVAAVMDPLVALVSDLRDRDSGTLHVFRAHFGALSPWWIEKAHDELRHRRHDRRSKPLQSEVRFAFHALKRRTAV